jgi:hypothetical protein
MMNDLVVLAAIHDYRIAWGKPKAAEGLPGHDSGHVKKNLAK